MFQKITFFLCLCISLLSDQFSENSKIMASNISKNESLKSQIKSGYIEVKGGKLFYDVMGQGKTMVMIHDGLLHREVWDEQFSALSKFYTVVRYDRRGYGRSSKPEEFYSNIDDLHTLFEKLNIDSACLMGMSAGGGLALDFTLAYPGKVTSLVLVGAVVSGFGFTDHFYDRGGHLSATVRANPEAFKNYWIEKDPYEIAPENTTAREKAKRLLKEHPNNMDLSKLRFEQGPKRPAIDALQEIQVPTLLIIGEYDIPDVHAHAGAIEAGIPNARRIIIRGAGHLVPLEHPAVFNEQLIRYFEEEDFFKILKNEGAVKAARIFKHKKDTDPNWVPFSENRMNLKGYQFLQAGNIKDAIEVFKLNILVYPDSWNVYDSLGEAYMKNGDKELAIKNYKKSLELNPDNENGKIILKKLEKMK